MRRPLQLSHWHYLNNWEKPTRCKICYASTVLALQAKRNKLVIWFYNYCQLNLCVSSIFFLFLVNRKAQICCGRITIILRQMQIVGRNMNELCEKCFLFQFHKIKTKLKCFSNEDHVFFLGWGYINMKRSKVILIENMYILQTKYTSEVCTE